MNEEKFELVFYLLFPTREFRPQNLAKFLYIYCYQYLLNRSPNAGELESCAQFVEASPDPKQGLAELCLALMNLNEFLFID